MTPYQTYALFLHPKGDDTAVLQADEFNRKYYENKGFVYLYAVVPPGVVAGPRDIDRDDSGIPKGPDGSTHDRHPDELTPDRQPVEWGFPLLGVKAPETTPQTEATMRRMGVNPRSARAGEENRVRGLLKDRDMPDERIKEILAGMPQSTVRSPEEEMDELSRQAVPPGVVIEKGGTRGLAGVDLTMPSPVAGINLNSVAQREAAVRRGDVVYEEHEVAPGHTVMRARAGQDVANEQARREAAEGDRATGARSTPGASKPAASEAKGDAPKSEAPKK